MRLSAMQRPLAIVLPTCCDIGDLDRHAFRGHGDGPAFLNARGKHRLGGAAADQTWAPWRRKSVSTYWVACKDSEPIVRVTASDVACLSAGAEADQCWPTQNCTRSRF